MNTESVVISILGGIGAFISVMLVWVIKIAATSLFDAIVSIRALTKEVSDLKFEIVKIRDLEKDVDSAHEKIRQIEKATQQ